jgi:hypothetical protein
LTKIKSAFNLEDVSAIEANDVLGAGVALDYHAWSRSPEAAGRH